ncbi:MAG: hypothetical protein MI748_11490 [Opitutales bacterium]|nr:hypothetical protein [Opitutales bacterium]
MIRRDFIKKSALLSSATFLTGISCRATNTGNELSKHTIDKVEFGKVPFSWPRLVGKNGRIGVHGQHKEAAFVRLFTNQGAIGWGHQKYGKYDHNALEESVLGKTVDQLIDPSRGILMGVDQMFDLALHDLAGVILRKPVYQLLGAKGQKQHSIYSGMIYLDELEPEDNPAGLEKVIENCQWDYDYGYRQLKVKIGRSGRWYPHAKGLATDIKVIQMIHEEFGDKVDILVDVNDMYSLQDTKDFLKGIEGIPLYWIEEPFVENLEEGRKLKDWMMENGWEKTFYADGERQPNHDVCMQLAKEGKLDVFLPDIVGFGMTPWRKLMPKLIDINTTTSPHAWGTMMKTHCVTHVAAGLGNVCTVEGATCVSDYIDFGDYEIKEGKITVSEKPGFGMNLMI